DEQVNEVLVSLFRDAHEERRALERAQLEPDAYGLQIGEHRLVLAADLEVTKELAGVEAVRVPGFGKQPSRSGRVVRIRRRRPVEVEARRDDAAGDLREYQCRGLVEGRGIEGQVGGQSDAVVVTGQLR